MQEFDLLIVAWCAFALFCGGLIKGTLGVGTPLLTVPLMALVLPAQVAVILMAMPVVVANVWQAFKAGRLHSAAVRFWPVFIAILIGTYGGVAILATIDERSLLLVVGAAVVESLRVFQSTTNVVSDVLLWSVVVCVCVAVLCFVSGLWMAMVQHVCAWSWRGWRWRTHWLCMSVV